MTTLTSDDDALLLMALGYLAGAYSKEPGGEDMLLQCIKLADKLGQMKAEREEPPRPSKQP